ncbi:MAG: PAS domain S-box protein [Acidobacteria bacterium]|nr:PAS domain S-box protein [Acidobacteriota bacterium]
MSADNEEAQLRAVALQNAYSIELARQRAEHELLRTREALRESQERLQAALTAAGTGTFRWDIPTNTVGWDGNLDRLFGLAPGDRTQSLETFIAAVHPDDRAAVTERVDQCARDGSAFDLEFRVVWPDGSLHWIHARARSFLDPAGRPLYMTGACADITSSKAAAAASRASEQRLRAMFSHAAVGIAVLELDGRFVEVNQKFCEVLGRSPDELRESSYTALTHPDDLAESAGALERLVSGTIAEFAVEKRYLRKDGSSVWSRSTVTLLTAGDGTPERFLALIEDITARRDADAALREETRILELLNETGSALAAHLDLRSLVQAVTDAATKLSGARFGAFFYNGTDDSGDAMLLYTLSGAPREAFEQFGNPRATALFGPTFRGEPPIRCDDVLADERYGTMPPHHGMPPGHLPVRSYLAVPVRTRAGEVIGGLFFGHPDPCVFSERTERLISGVAAQAGVAIDNARLYDAANRAADERSALLRSERAARTAAEHMSSMKDEFLATLSHELRTPLNAILGWAHVLRHGTHDADDLRKGLETIERNARAQNQLVEDLLDMSRITSGKVRLDIQTISPAAFIEAALESAAPAAKAKGIRVERLLDQSAGPISGDPNRLQQVIWNLLSNAIKFTPKGGKIQLLLERVNSHIEISLADTGVGISAEFIPYLFDRFRQGDASTTRRYGGLGLGLSIVKSLTELHGGTVSVHSAGEGQGTTVTVHLPLVAVYRTAGGEARVHPAAQQPATPIDHCPELAGLTILVVDDHEDSRALVRRVLEDCAATVLTAGSVPEAQRIVETHALDVVVSDIGMPGQDGFDLLRRIRALGPHQGGRVPAIALTAFARAEDRTRALRAGFLVHIAKPVDPLELVATVASVAGRLDRQP